MRIYGNSGAGCIRRNFTQPEKKKPKSHFPEGYVFGCLESPMGPSRTRRGVRR